MAGGCGIGCGGGGSDVELRLLRPANALPNALTPALSRRLSRPFAAPAKLVRGSSLSLKPLKRLAGPAPPPRFFSLTPKGFGGGSSSLLTTMNKLGRVSALPHVWRSLRAQFSDSWRFSEATMCTHNAQRSHPRGHLPRPAVRALVLGALGALPQHRSYLPLRRRPLISRLDHIPCLHRLEAVNQ